MKTSIASGNRGFLLINYAQKQSIRHTFKYSFLVCYNLATARAVEIVLSVWLYV